MNIVEARETEDYYVRYGGDGGLETVERSDYLTEKEARKLYDKIELGKEIRWKELWYSPVDGDPEGEDEVLVSEAEVKEVDLGICKVYVPKKLNA